MTDKHNDWMKEIFKEYIPYMNDPANYLNAIGDVLKVLGLEE